MLNAFRTFFTNIERVLKVDKNFMLPLLRWFSYSHVNVKEIAKINYTAFWIPQDVTYANMFYGINQKARFIKYLKRPKKEKEDLLIECLKKYFKSTKSELLKNWKLIEPQLTDAFLKMLVVKLGLEDKVARKLGVKPEKFAYEPPKQKTLFSF